MAWPWQTGALAALLLAACGYDDTALTPPDRGPALHAATTAGTVGAVGAAGAATAVGAAGAATAVGAAEAHRGDFGLGVPFVVIRFGPEPVDFEEPLAGAIAEALAQRPDVKFHLLAVTAVTASGGPQLGRAPSLRHAEAVLRSLAAMGVPADEVFVAAVASPANLIDEVRLYLR
jgi:hypothetical protein